MIEEYNTIIYKKLFKIIISNKKIFITIFLLLFIPSCIYVFFLKNEYTSEGRILPELNSKGSGIGQFAGLASLAGIDINSVTSSTDALRPDIYPEIINSKTFYLELLKLKVKTKDNKEINFVDFLHDYVENGKEIKAELTEKVILNDTNIIVLDGITEKRIEVLKSRIKSDIDKKTGIISIKVKMPDPVVAARICRYGMDYLMDYVIDYRTNKIKKDVIYLENQVLVSKGKYYRSQEKKASYSDRFQSETIRLQTADLQRERIDSEYKLSSTFYNELLKRYEEAKFKLHQETPVFKILDIPPVPFKKSAPIKSLMIIGCFILSFLGGLLSVLIINKNYKSIITRGN